MTYSASPGAVAACGRCGSERLRVVEGDFDQARRKGRALGPGDHAVLVHSGPAQAAPYCARFLGEGVERGERVVAALPTELQDSVVAEVSAEVEGTVEWEEPSTFYGDFDADRVASAYEALMLEEPRTTRILAGLDRGCAEGVEPDEWARYEAKAHAIIIRLGANVLCFYDADVLSPALVDVAVRRHGLVVENDNVRRNERFEYAPL